MNIEVKRKKQSEQWSEGLIKIRDRILDPNIKVISFDVFDTLLFRPVSTPADTFRLLENKLRIPNFHNMRITAEAEARKYKDISSEDITLDAIYERYAYIFGLTDEESNKIKQAELDLEYAFLYPRKAAKFLFEEAKNANKKIIIISDMYLSSEFLKKALIKNGYEGFTDLYVSSETGCLKSSRGMYYLVLSRLKADGIIPTEVLHIGDNKKADVDSAIASGLNARHLPKPADIRNDCKQLRRLYGYIIPDVMNTNNAILYGFLANLYFDDPFVDFNRDSFFNGDAKLMGYWFAPLMIGFTKWFIETTEEEKIEELLFVWRDGYLPLRLFSIMRPMFTKREIDVRQIYLGRGMRMPFQSLDKNGFFTTLSDYGLSEDITVEHFIKNRLFCDNEEQYEAILKIFRQNGYINDKMPIGKFEKYRGFLHELEPFFIENAKDKIKRYSKYIRSQVDENKKIASFDRSPRGKLARFFNNYFNIDAICVTTELYDAGLNNDGKIKSYLEYGKYQVNKMGNIWAMIFERVISDTGPGFFDVVEYPDGSVDVVLDTPEENDTILEANDIVTEIQAAIIEFTEQLTNVMGEYLPYLVIDRHGVFDYTIDFLSSPHRADADLVVKINPDKSFLAPIDENVFIKWYNSKFKKNTKPVIVAKDLSIKQQIIEKGYILSERLGILTQARSIYRFFLNKPQNPELSVENIQANTDAHIEKLKELGCSDISVLFLGSSPQEVSPFFNYLSQQLSGYDFLFVAAGFLRVPTCYNFPCIDAPKAFGFWTIEGFNKDIALSTYIQNEVRSKQYLLDLVERRVLRGYSRSVATLLAFEAERYFRELICILNPKLVMTWNNWGNNSVVPATIAREKRIPVISAERGFIEGTIMLSPDGFGKDSVNVTPDKFCALPVNDDDTKKAKMLIDYICGSGYNRYTQPLNDVIERLKLKINNGKKTLLLVGSFDCENPAFPQSEETKKLYSPMFGTSFDAMTYISKLCNKNDWNIIFKPHPLMAKIDRSAKRKYPVNVDYIEDANINDLLDIADVVVCLISGVSYIALMRGKPLVELTYTPLKGKECCYEVSSENDIEPMIKEALKNGFTTRQSEAFIKHVAQINKYYFFDDMSARPIRYGRSISDAVTLLQNTIENSDMEVAK